MGLTMMIFIYITLLYTGIAGLVFLANRNERERQEMLLKESIRWNVLYGRNRGKRR